MDAMAEQNIYCNVISTENEERHPKSPRCPGHHFWNSPYTFGFLLLTTIVVLLFWLWHVIEGSSCTCPTQESNLTHIMQGMEQKLSCMTERIQDNGEMRPCPENWIFQNEMCYFFSDIKESRNECDKFCKSHKAWLANVRSTQTGLLTLVKNMKKGFWIGLVKERRDTYEMPLWYWSDNNTEFHVRNDREGMTCAKLDQELTAEACASKLHWICEKEAEIHFYKIFSDCL